MSIAAVRPGAASSIQRCIANRSLHRVEAWYGHQALPPRRLPQTQVLPADTVPFRKLLKDEAKKQKTDPEYNDPPNSIRINENAVLDRWELTVGLEIHAQLNAEHKLFSDAQASASHQPNTHVSTFDLALPGSQPVLQKGTLLPAIRAALALKCKIQHRSQFDRKHYFYADQPAGYQITQYYQPFAIDGSVLLFGHDGIGSKDGNMVEIGIKQVQLEQDTAKTLLHPPSEARLDFNRVSHPLIEIITLPQIHQPKTAAACVRKIQALLQAVNAVSAGMDMGGLRADVNVSVRRRDSLQHHAGGKLGQRTEIKNLSSIKAVEDAIVAERNRQISILESGGLVESETRGWTLGASDTVKLRGKEGEVDYRYMPDPDLRPLWISDGLIESTSEHLPRLPDENLEDLVQHHGLTIKDAKTLIDLEDGERLDYFDKVCEEYAALCLQSHESLKAARKEDLGAHVTIGNWVLHELGGLLSTSQVTFTTNQVPPKDLAYVVLMLGEERITGRTAKQLFARKFNGDAQDVKTIIERENLALEQMPEQQYAAMARQLISQNSAMAAQIKDKGQIGKLGFFVGQMMRQGEGKVVAKRAEATLRQLLELPNR